MILAKFYFVWSNFVIYCLNGYALVHNLESGEFRPLSLRHIIEYPDDDGMMWRSEIREEDVVLFKNCGGQVD